MELSIENNKENVYAYLALGDALERQKKIKKAIYVYRDLMSIGITVHGLKEKLIYLENLHEENLRFEIKEKEQIENEKKLADIADAEKQKIQKDKDENERMHQENMKLEAIKA